MLSNAMEKAHSAAADTPLPTASTRPLGAGEHDYPDKLDAGLLRISGVCILATVMAILDVTVVAVAQRTFIAQFGSTQAVVAWTMTGYTLALATVIPVTGGQPTGSAPNGSSWARCWPSRWARCCARWRQTSLQLIIFRVMQGIGGGMLLPLGFMILTREAGPQRLGRLMSILSIPMLLAPIGGPILGGWLIDTSSWRWIFLINLPIGLVTIVLAAIVFPRDHPARSETFDVIGVLLLSPGLATFLFAVSSIPRRGTVADRHVLIPATIGLALIAAFVVHARYRADHPLIDLRLFQQPGAHPGQCDDAGVRERVFRRRAVAPELLPAGATPDADAGRRAHDPPGTRCHVDDAADRAVGGQTRARARSCWSASR